MANTRILICLELDMQMVKGGRHGEIDEDTIFNTSRTYKIGQPHIGDEEEGEEADNDNVDVGDGGDDALEVQDVEDEDKGLTEDIELQRIQKEDSIDILSDLRMKPEELFHLHISLCRLVSMPMVRPTLACDITKLEQEFAGGYRDGAAVFYVSTTNEEGQSKEFSDEEMSKWDPIWREKNEVFTRYLESQREVNFLKNLKFFICDGNHWRLAWMNVIDRCYTLVPKWHFVVDCILLETKGWSELVMQVMHDINK